MTDYELSMVFERIYGEALNQWLRLNYAIIKDKREAAKAGREPDASLQAERTRYRVARNFYRKQSDAHYAKHDGRRTIHPQGVDELFIAVNRMAILDYAKAVRKHDTGRMREIEAFARDCAYSATTLPDMLAYVRRKKGAIRDDL